MSAIRYSLTNNLNKTSFIGKPYWKRVQSLKPIAYWPLWDKSGIIAEEVMNGYNGIYVGGITLGQSGIGDGKVCPLFTGTNPGVNIYSAGLAGKFDPDEHTIMSWVKPTAPIWGTTAYTLVKIGADSNNRSGLAISNIANETLAAYVAGSTVKASVIQDLSFTDWRCFAQVTSKKNDFITSYINLEKGTISSSLGDWSGNLANGHCNIGYFVTGVQHWIGNLAHVAIFDRALTQRDFLELLR